MTKRKKIGIIIDYALRFPSFSECYNVMKEQILLGMQNASESELNERDISERDFWSKLYVKDLEAYSFYETKPSPKENSGVDFDYSWDSYFYNEEHKLKFIEDWSFNLYSQSALTCKSEDINLINITQSKLCDVVLIDIASHSRKIPATFAFLGKARCFVKELRFLSLSELNLIKDEFVGIYNPLENNQQLIPKNEPRKPSTVFLNWLIEIEKKINNK